MRKTVNLSTIIKTVILILAVTLIFLVYPCRVFKSNIEKVTPRVTEEYTGVINYKHSAMQAFVADYDHIDSISLYVKEGSGSDKMWLKLVDGQGRILADESKVMTGVSGKAEFEMDVDLVVGDVYFLKFDTVKSLYLAEEAWQPDSGILAMSYYDDVLLEGRNIVMDYNYIQPLNKVSSLLFIGIVILAAAVLLSLTHLVFKDEKRDKFYTVQKALKAVCNPLIILLTVACFVFIFAGKVTPYTLDKTVACIGTVFLGAILWYIVNHNYDGVPSYFNRDYIVSHIPDFLQSIAIMGAISSCCEYVSGFYDIDHYVAERKQMIWVALIILTMFEVKEIVNWYNLAYVIVAAIAGVLYYNSHITEEMSEADRFVVKGNVFVAALLGLILIRTIKCLIQKKMSRFNVGYALIIAVYFVMIIIFRNTRWWTVTLAVVFTLIILNLGFWNKKKNFIDNVIRGVELHFVLSTIWVLMYRPFDNLNGIRFTHCFHTSTITATYMTMVMAVAMTALISKIRKTCMDKDENGRSVVVAAPKLNLLWKELLFFGAVVTYSAFTMARTAIFAIVVAFAFTLIVLLFGTGLSYCKLALKSLGWMILVAVMTFVTIFELQRTVPCLVSDPYVFDIDQFSDDLLRGHKLNDNDYITAGRFTEVFLSKMLGIDENTFVFYDEEVYDFNEYHETPAELITRGYYDFKKYDLTDEQLGTPIDEDPELLSMYNGAGGERVEAAIEQAKENGTYTGNDDDYEISIEEYEEMWAAEEEAKQPVDYTNGRVDIYKSYLEQLNMTGHDGMGAILQDGSEATHAHDVYLQVAFDHGIPTAVIFIVFGVVTFILAIGYYKKNRFDAPQKILTAVVLLSFAVAGVVEWTYHLSHPMAFVLWLTIIPLLFGRSEQTEDEHC